MLTPLVTGREAGKEETRTEEGRPRPYVVLQKETRKLVPDSPVRVMMKVAKGNWALKCSETNSSKMSGLSCQAFFFLNL